MFDVKGMTAVPLPVLSHADSGPKTGGRLVLLIGLVAAALLSRVGFLARPFDSDSGLYIYMGKALLEGQTLYHDIYETKPPGVALFTAGLFKLFGYHWAPYVLLQAAMTVFASHLLARAAARHLGERAAAPIFAFSVVYLNFSPVAYRGFQLETVQSFFACVAAGFGLRAMAALAKDGASTRSPDAGRTALVDCFWLGLFTGAAAMLKPTATAVAGAFLFFLLVRRRPMLRLSMVALAGLLIVPMLVFIWTWRAGLLPDMLPLFHEISLYANGTPMDAADWIKPVVAAIVAGFPFIVAWICRTGAVPAARLNQSSCYLQFTLIWLVLELAGVILQRRMYTYHFLPLAPPMAMLFGYFCGGRRARAYAVAFVPILLLSLAHSRGDWAVLLSTGPRNLPQSDYLLAHATPADTVVGDPIERLLMETRLRAGSRYGHLFYFCNHDEAPLEYGRRFLEDLDRNKPTWAVFRTDRIAHRTLQAAEQTLLSERPRREANFFAAWEQIDAYLSAHYQPVAQAGEMTIFRRK